MLSEGSDEFGKTLGDLSKKISLLENVSFEVLQLIFKEKNKYIPNIGRKCSKTFAKIIYKRDAH